MTVSNKSHQDGPEQEEGWSGRDGGKIEWGLSEVNIRALSRGQNKLIGKFKMADGCD